MAQLDRASWLTVLAGLPKPTAGPGSGHGDAADSGGWNHLVSPAPAPAGAPASAGYAPRGRGIVGPVVLGSACGRGCRATGIGSPQALSNDKRGF